MVSRCLTALILLCSAALADLPPPAVSDDGGRLAKADAGQAAYEHISEWSGTFLVKGMELGKDGQFRETSTHRIRMDVIEPRWRMEMLVLGEKGEMESRTVEVFDGMRNWVYLDWPDEKVGMVYAHVPDARGSWVPSYPKKGMSTGAQEVRSLVMGGHDHKGRGFSYYAGRPKGAPEGTQAFVRLGRNGWPGWTATFLDPSRQYIPVEIWRGNKTTTGKPKTMFSGWKADEKGRLYAGEMRDEFIKPKERNVTLVTIVTTERFTRKVDPELVKGISFPKGTEVMPEHDPGSRHVVGGKD